MAIAWTPFLLGEIDIINMSPPCCAPPATVQSGVECRSDAYWFLFEKISHAGFGVALQIVSGARQVGFFLATSGFGITVKENLPIGYFLLVRSDKLMPIKNGFDMV